MHQIKKSRPHIPLAKIDESNSAEERFQNEILRPVIKMQHDLLVVVFKQYLKDKKNQYFQLTADKRKEYIKNAFSKDLYFRNLVKGLIIGQFTPSEYKEYILNSSALSKRIISITQERILSSMVELQNLV